MSTINITDITTRGECGHGSTNPREFERLNYSQRGPVDDRYNCNMSLGRDSWRSSTQPVPVNDDSDDFQYQRQTMRTFTSEREQEASNY